MLNHNSANSAHHPSKPHHRPPKSITAEDFVVALLKERTITGKVVIFVQSKRSCQQLADRLKQMRHLEVGRG